MLLTRAKDGWPTGILPLAFSDIPRSCSGTASSTEDETDGVRELWLDGVDCEGVGCNSCSSSSESSSPIAKEPSSSGTLLRDGVRALAGLLKLSIELFRGLNGLPGFSDPSVESFRSWFSLSISSWPLSKVKERSASNRFRLFKIASTNLGFSEDVSYSDQTNSREAKAYCRIYVR